MRTELGHPAASDRWLVVAAKAGDKEAYAALLRRHRGLLLVLCRRLLGRSDVAEDVAQEACLQGMLSLERLRYPDRFGSWLAGIGLNLCRQWLREQATEAWSLEALQGGRWGPEPVDQAPAPEEVAEAAEATEAIRRAVAHLPPGQREAVMLFYLAGLTQQEIADALGTTPGAVKARLHKARLRLRDQLSIMWKEEDMGVGARTEWVEMEVTDVRRAPAEGDRAARYVVLLQEDRGDRSLPIWVGPFEGTAIAMILEQAELPRPATYSFAASVLQAVGGRLREARITRLADVTYYAEAVLEGGAGTATVDARPSDAIALALLSGAPVRASSALMESLEEGRVVEEFQRERQSYGAGARDIAEERKSAWERDLEEFRKGNR